MHIFAHGDSRLHNRRKMPKRLMILGWIKTWFAANIEGVFGGSTFLVLLNSGGWKETFAGEIIHFIFTVFGGLIMLFGTYIVKVEFGPWYEKKRKIFKKKKTKPQ